VLRHVAIATFLILSGLLIADAALRQASPSLAAAHPLMVAQRDAAAAAPTEPAPDPPVVVPPVEPAGTPTFDLMARLAVRRRLAREGNAVYIDSQFVHSDSNLVHWTGKPTLLVRLIPDTLLGGWMPDLLDEARAAMHIWDENGAGLQFREATPDDSADVTVTWVATLPDSGQVGTTALRWSADGVVLGATIQLALRRNYDSLLLGADQRARVAVHEFGHALGLPHSDRPTDIMFWTSPVAQPSARDQTTLQLLYALPPGPVKLPPGANYLQ
jgi:hypothetical protein